MKFVHIADMHFDSPFINLSDKEGLGDKCRLKQRQAFKKVIEYIKENKVSLLLISGDLYEQKYIKKTTIEYINNLFKEIPHTHIFIAPGNHDPYIKNSYYNQFAWNENVTIFNSSIKKVELDEINVYGYGFEEFYCENSGIEEFEIEDKNKANILVIHGALNASTTEERKYNPMSEKMLKEKGFEYVALGHIHKPYYKKQEQNYIVYPGSMFPLGFDELGQRGMIVGEINKKETKIEFVNLADYVFIEKDIDVTDIISKEELIEKINELPINEDEFVKIILKGKRNFEIDTYELYKFIETENIIKIKDQTQINYDLEKIAKQSTLKGKFVEKMLEKLNNVESDEEREIIENSIEIGLQVLD